MSIKVVAISTFTVGWYWTSSINAVATQELVGHHSDSEVTPILLALILTLSQLAVGGILSICVLLGMKQIGFADTSVFANWDQGWPSKNDVMVGFLHYVGCLCTNMGFAYGSASLVQVIKLLEPIETLFLTVLVTIFRSRGRISCSTVGEVVSLQQAFGTLIIIGGTSMLLSQNSMKINPRSVVAALASGFCMSSRNVLKKSVAPNEKEMALPRAGPSHVSNSCADVFTKGIKTFCNITLIAAISAIAMLLPSMIAGSISPQQLAVLFKDPGQPFAKAVFFHCGYNVASITVLSLTSALVHSLLNVGKRIVNVLVVAVIFGVPLTISGKVGLAVAAVGTIVYNKEAFRRLLKNACSYKHLALVVLVLLFCSINLGISKAILSENDLTLVSEKDAPMLAYVELAPRDLLATMAAASPCEKTVILDGHEVSSGSAFEYDMAGDDNIVCIQIGKVVGAAVYMGSIVQRSTFSVMEKYLNEASIPHRIVERKDVIMSGRYLPATKESNAEREKDGNKGNFVWQYGATNLVNPYTTRLVTAKNNETAVYILSSANLFLFRKDAPHLEKMMINMAQSMANTVAKYDLPSVVIGIGAQVEFGADVSTVTMDGYDSYKQLLREVESRQKSKSIAVRGDVTERICQNSGFTHCLSMGCPSLTISRNMDLGGVLKEKWDVVRRELKKDGGKKLKVVLALPALQLSNKDYGPAVDLLMAIYAQHDCYFILQSNYDRHQLLTYTKGSVNKTRVLEYEDQVEPWFDFMKSVDFVLSYRIHGAMAGIINEVPAVVIPTDFRILELVNAMKLPLLPMEKTKTKKYFSLLSILDDVSADFDEFEQNRRDKLKQYKRILGDVGLEIDPALNAVLSQ
eukprot:CAMPEP_0195295866 /NCGR_PEP_ID=MMETSP0707-20130614/18215_1 /TAXON_ID=33640 /ORGANISM="Asterionellopsis glacialis, Strain CCMP134" /LENGTH=858 /DNA_ID=CAMNT_0040357197 /DNA_START=61 /DNA_END=2637 /DNA_ORIENTATION=-